MYSRSNKTSQDDSPENFPFPLLLKHKFIVVMHIYEYRVCTVLKMYYRVKVFYVSSENRETVTEIGTTFSSLYVTDITLF